MNVPLLLLAEYANTTADSKLNVMGIFTQIYSMNFPAVHTQMYLVAQLGASPAEYGRKFKFGVKLINDDGKELSSFESDIEVPKADNGQSVTMNFIMPFVNVVFEQPGNYQFSLLINEDEKATYSLQVVLLPATPPVG